MNKTAREGVRRPVFRTARRWLLGLLGLIVTFYAVCALSLFAMRWIAPVTSSVQVQRRIEALLTHKPYTKRYAFVPLSRVSHDLQHAVISAEDGRFYQHHGIDWTETQKVVEKGLEEGHMERGASTITQQLVKNLFLTTSRSGIRKAVEFTLAPLAELILPKQRILELYLNVIEWGPGIYGAEAASRTYYGVPASKVTREQAARLAAIIPSPRHRRPNRMDHYSTMILDRMRTVGW
jgi:monofunctional biosynthetic peptidoglycan transglycosylase